MLALWNCLVKFYNLQIRRGILVRDLLLILSSVCFGIALVKLQHVHTGSRNENNSIAQRLAQSELAWRRNSAKISYYEASIQPGRFPNQKGVNNDDGTVIWHYFVSSFDCPFGVERLGRIGDGGKWVCGLAELAKKKDCVVYSFGVASDSSFEEEILARTQCRVRMYDPTVKKESVSVLEGYPERTTFLPIGISGKDKRGFHTLRTFMEKNGDSFLDILKMDVEEAEWQVLEQIIADFGGEFPFAQLQIEMHVFSFPAEVQFASLRKAWNALENAGLRPFRDEPNLQIRSAIYFNHEFAFVNTKSVRSPFYLNRTIETSTVI